MSSEEFGGVLRALLAFAAGFIPATFMDASTSASVVGALVTIGVAMWSVYQKRTAGAVKPIA